MKLHQNIDKRSMEFAQIIADSIDNDPGHKSLEIARKVCKNWLDKGHEGAVEEWHRILQGPWSSIKSVLLDSSDYGNRLRQSSPFCGIISNRQRWEIIKKYKDA